MINDAVSIFLGLSIGLVTIVIIAYLLQQWTNNRGFQREQTVKNEYSELPEELRNEWVKIVPSGDKYTQYRPCSVTLRNGSKNPCVYVMDAQTYINVWGMWPDSRSGRENILIDDVVSIKESPYRIPANFASEIYRAGESGMGYFIFSLIFSDGTSQAYITGDAIDFVDLPEGKKYSDITSVIPHRGRGLPCKEGRKYTWCLFGVGEVHYPRTVEELGLK